MSRIEEARVDITYYTDPLCSWSWAFEPQWRRLRYEFGDGLAWRYVMGGMIPDWNTYSDPHNDIHSPAQMGPHWLYVSRTTGMPIDSRLWREDPPVSSYPASLAVKAAEMQGWEDGQAYLRRLREAAMLERRNIARPEVLIELAEALADDVRLPAPFDPDRFRADLEGETARDAFREDLKDTRYRGIGRYPSLILRPPAGPALLIVGYRPYSALRAALDRAAPGLKPARTASGALEYASHWGRITVREVAEALERDDESVAPMLRSYAALIPADPEGTSRSSGESLNEPLNGLLSEPSSESLSELLDRSAGS